MENFDFLNLMVVQVLKLSDPEVSYAPSLWVLIEGRVAPYDLGSGCQAPPNSKLEQLLHAAAQTAVFKITVRLNLPAPQPHWVDLENDWKVTEGDSSNRLIQRCQLLAWQQLAGNQETEHLKLLQVVTLSETWKKLFLFEKSSAEPAGSNQEMQVQIAPALGKTWWLHQGDFSTQELAQAMVLAWRYVLEPPVL